MQTSTIETSATFSKGDVVRAINSWRRREFDYGDSDCCSFVAHVASELTGRDYRSFITYNNEQEAYDIIRSHGSFGALMDSVFGNIGEPIDGDPCLMNLPIIGEIMGIKFKGGVVCVTKSGLIKLDDRYIVRSWNLCHRPYSQ